MTRERHGTLWAECRDRMAGYEPLAETSGEICRLGGASVASLFSWRRRRLTPETAAAESVAAAIWQLSDADVLAGAIVDSAVAWRGGRRTELPNGAVGRLTGEAERLLRNVIAAVRCSVCAVPVDES